jgi:hypothetical protein
MSPAMTLVRRMAALAGILALAGCAGLRTVACDVSSYGEWPAERRPGSYAFERLPSQQARAAESGLIEAGARKALERAGFHAAEAGSAPEILVQVGAHDDRAEVEPWDDPVWWRGGFGFGYGHRGPWGGPHWGVWGYHELPRYERQVALLLRDRASGKPLFEARAGSAGVSRADAALFAAMFQAALMDFPRLGLNPRRIVVTLDEGAVERQ